MRTHEKSNTTKNFPQPKQLSQFTDYTPLPNDWTVVEESAEASAFDVREVVPVPRTSVHPPTSPISTRAENDMSLTLFSETDVVQSETSEVVVNDENFQLEELQDAIEELKKENVDLTEENKDLRATCSSLLARIDELTSQKDDLMTKQVHKNHEIARLKLRVGGQGRVINSMKKGLFPHESQHVGYGTFLNGKQVFWRKASQKEWDEDLHAPLFGYNDPGCNFVLLQRADPARNSDESCLVHAVGCHVVPGTSVKFKINDEEACFGF